VSPTPPGCDQPPNNCFRNEGTRPLRAKPIASVVKMDANGCCTAGRLTSCELEEPPLPETGARFRYRGRMGLCVVGLHAPRRNVDSA
jgi:hypothetical protein